MQIFLTHILSLIQNYGGNPPLSHYLTQYFKANHQLGSRDRRAISEAVYLYYRTARFFAKGTTDIFSIIKYGFEETKSKNAFLRKILANVDEKNIIQTEKPLNELIFSEGMFYEDWTKGFQTQPDLFIRILRDFKKNVQKLQASGREFEVLNGFEPLKIIRLPNSTPVQNILSAKDYLVQDLSSQTTLQSIYPLLKTHHSGAAKVWDACAGAGGKSLLWHELFPEDSILATDVRESIINNLKIRIRQHQVTQIQPKILNAKADFSNKSASSKFDFIIGDVPCSGSGTWGRTPEQFHFFKSGQLTHFTELQYSISLNALHYLKKDGLFVYITCSVFKQENEEIIKRLVDTGKVAVQVQGLIQGQEQHADSLFRAVLQKV